MNWMYRLLHLLFGWQFVLIVVGKGAFQVYRARYIHGSYFIKLQPSEGLRVRYIYPLMPDRMANSSLELIEHIGFLATGDLIRTQWLPLTEEIKAHTLMVQSAAPKSGFSGVSQSPATP